jgi:hypothetical protein
MLSSVPPALSFNTIGVPGGAPEGTHELEVVAPHIIPPPIFLTTVYGPVPPDQLIVAGLAPVIFNGDPTVPPEKFSDVVSDALYKTLSVTVAVILYEPLEGTV